jgi:hypothetical protein
VQHVKSLAIDLTSESLLKIRTTAKATTSTPLQAPKCNYPGINEEELIPDESDQQIKDTDEHGKSSRRPALRWSSSNLRAWAN